MTKTPLARRVPELYPDFLRDESRKTGHADAIAFPAREEEVLDLIKSTSGPITIQGARTGITGGAVPNGGLIINMSRMSRITGLRESSDPEKPYTLFLQPGVPLRNLRSAVSDADFETLGWSKSSIAALTAFREDGRCFFFPPDPTEDTASLGGMLSCNASGARSYKYGPTRNYVVSLRLVTAEGSLISLRRNSNRATGTHFHISANDTEYCGEIPSYSMPRVKNASGYFAQHDMDMLDLFIGAEGTLGVITEIEIALAAAPAINWAVMAFFPDTASAEHYVRACRNLESNSLASIEFFDDKSIDLLRKQKKNNPAFAYLPDMKADWFNCVFVELDGFKEERVETAAMQLADLINACGGSESATWMATEPAEMERMKKFRHALPESVNLTIDAARKRDPSLTKLGTDFAVPNEHMHAMLSTYKLDLDSAGLDYVIFGHIGNDHLHVNILPTSIEDYERGKSLYLKWAGLATRVGGTVSAEHGIGKLKTALLEKMYGIKGIEQMRRLKAVFDPESRLNRGNLFEVPL